LYLVSILREILHLRAYYCENALRANLQAVAMGQTRHWETGGKGKVSMNKLALTSFIRIASLCVSALASCAIASAQSQATNQRLPPDELRLRQDWHLSMAQIPFPGKGCFQARYPIKEWHLVPCVPTPNYPLLPAPPRHGPRPLIVGNNNDVSPQTPSGFISTAIGSFDSASGITTESGPVGNSGPSLSDTYTLQMNTNFFSASTTVCKNAADPSVCQGWQQFVYENNTASTPVHSAYIQYWLIQYNTTCPSGQSWNQISLYGGIYCWKNNSGGAAPVPTSQSITNLGNMSLTGSVSSSGDSVSVFDGTMAYGKPGDNAVAAASGWNVAEFNIFGDGGNSSGGGTASFAGTPTLTPRTRIIYGGRDAPTCTANGFTAEKNNLSFGPTAPAASQPGPAISFTESSAGGATSNCAGATAVGDPHLATFNGLFYDFQAQGEFILAQAPNFVVQTRQVSGAPTWPNAAVNHAVATQMGKDRIAVCLARVPLDVNGANTDIADGTSFSTPDGVDIWRTGNVYLITDQTGNSVRAEVNPTWINVSVGLGRWPEKVTGLLANVNGDVNTLAARDGTTLKSPFAFADFYQRFGESWRVKSEESLLSACGGERIENSNPTAVFTAADLEQSVRERARAVCTAAGVKGDAYLDACTLDVAVIGNNDAAKVFTTLPQPVAVATITGGPGSSGTSGILKWLLWIILILILLWIIRLLTRRRTP